MVSFQCETCGDTLKKPKLDQHAQRCWAVYTCIDCNVTFQNQDYRSHTSCISEDQKYQKSVYKAPKGKGQKGQQQQQQPTPAPTPAPSAAPIVAPVEPSPAAASVNGVHPSRMHMVQDAAPAQQKRAREEPIVVAAATPAEVAETEEPEKKKKKKSKKQVKGAFGNALKAEAEASGEAVAPPKQPEGTIAGFLKELVPTLLTESKSLGSLKETVIEKAKEAGWREKRVVEKAFEEGLWLGGDKPKRMLKLQYEA